MDACKKQNIAVEVVPGPDAVTAALSVSGIPLSGYCFLGFIPHKKGRETFLKNILEETGVAVFFESPHRILKTLLWLHEHKFLGKIIIARELSKMHEEVARGSIDEIYNDFAGREKVQGEFVVIVDRRGIDHS